MRRKAGTTLIVSLLVTGTLMGIAIFTSKTASAAWNIETVDFPGAVGTYTSLALNSSGYPRISYYDLTNRDLKYARWTGTMWNIERVDSTNDVGKFSSLALDTNGNPRISYLDNTANDLKYAKWTGASWNIEIVDSVGNVGSDTSLVLDSNGYPRISYFEFLPNYNLKYAKWTGASWSIETVDSTGVVGEHSSIALDGNEYPRISYHDYTNYDLKYAKWTGSAWNFETVDSVGDVGDWTSLALDSNWYPHISYYDLTNRDLKYAKWTGSAWSIETIDSTGNVGTHTSLALDSSGYPHISYFDVTNADLKYAGWTGAAWNIETVDAAGDVGGDTSIALDSNWYPCISYTDYTNADLKYTKMTGGPSNNPPNTPSTPSGPSSGVVGTSYAYSTSATDPDGDTVKYIFDWGDGNTSETGYVPSGTTAGQSHAWGSKGTYQVRARAVDIHGASSGWSGTLAVTITTFPGAPISLVATPGDTQVTLTWSPPADDGGSPITNYRIYRGTTSGGETFLVQIGSVLTYLDAGLTNGVTYFYKVAAVNAVDEGPKSTEASATPATTPSDPLNLQATLGDAQVVLTWTAPVSDGGSLITNYRTYRGTAPGAETFLVEIGNVLTYTDTGVVNGQTYCYKISAKNSVGEGPQSNEACTTPATTPSKPLNLQAFAGNTQITLTWNAPAVDGGSAITNYRIYRGVVPGGETFLVEVGNVLTYLDTGLTNGQTYYYKVTAVNGVGEGTESNEASATPTSGATVPSEPLNLQAFAGDAQVTLLWEAPATDGGSPITNYRIYRGTTAGGETFLVEIGNVLTYADTSVVNGQIYYYKVSAKNTIGEGPPSNEVSATPSSSIQPPSPPQNLVAAAGNGQVTLTWAAPVSDGGSPVTNYRIYRGTASGGESFLIEIGNITTHTDTGLTNGQTYYYEVTAKNVAGESLKSNEASATPATTPTEPLNLQASPGDAQVVLAWNAPTSNGGFLITNYRIYRGTTSGSETVLVEIGNVLTYMDTGLANGQTYYYTVRAKNAVGEGPSSNEASATPVTIPSKPLNLQAFAGDAQITLTWDAPASDGGSPITNYRIYRGTIPGGEAFHDEIGNVLTYLDVGLTNGQTYYYEVTAVNGAGEGPKSDETSATPTSGVTTPLEPRNLQAVAGDAQVALTWEAPASDGGSAIINYRIYRGTTPSGETFLIETGNVFAYTDTSVVNDQTYYYKVSAVNSIGEGQKSNEASATPSSSVLPPSPPRNLVAVAGNADVTLTWMAPVSDGGSPITNYRIYRGSTSGFETFLTQIGNVLTYLDTALVNGQTYYYRVSAKNSVGEGPKSNEASATPSAPPPVNQPPTCTITSPQQGETISGSYAVAGTAADPDGIVQYVEVSIDGDGWMQATGSTSWGFQLDTRTLVDGQHTIHARSFDGTNHSNVVSVTVTVQNAAAPPSPGGKSTFEELWFWALIIIVVIAIIVILILAVRRKKKDEKSGTQPQPPQEKP